MWTGSCGIGRSPVWGRRHPRQERCGQCACSIFAGLCGYVKHPGSYEWSFSLACWTTCKSCKICIEERNVHVQEEIKSNKKVPSQLAAADSALDYLIFADESLRRWHASTSPLQKKKQRQGHEISRLLWSETCLWWTSFCLPLIALNADLIQMIAFFSVHAWMQFFVFVNCCFHLTPPEKPSLAAVKKLVEESTRTATGNHVLCSLQLLVQGMSFLSQLTIHPAVRDTFLWCSNTRGITAETMHTVVKATGGISVFLLMADSITSFWMTVFLGK